MLVYADEKWAFQVQISVCGRQSKWSLFLKSFFRPKNEILQCCRPKIKFYLKKQVKLYVFYRKKWLWSRSLRKWGVTQWQFSIKRLFWRSCHQGSLPSPPAKKNGLKRLRMMNETHGDITKYWKLSRNMKKIDLKKIVKIWFF